MSIRGRIARNPLALSLYRRIASPRKARSSQARAHISGYELPLVQRSARSTFTDLWDAEFRIYSQWGEDGILNYLCDLFGLDRPRILEIGAGNFTECNSRFFAEFRSAAVVAVDGRSDLERTMAATDLYWRSTIHGLEQFATPENITELEQTVNSLIGPPDIVSLDIDGNDYWVLEQADLSRASIVVVEYNPLFGSAAPLTVPRDDNFDRSEAHFSYLYFGASLKAWIHLLERRGFTFLGTTRSSVNAFFCANDLVSNLPIDIPATDSLERYTHISTREGRDSQGRLAYFDVSEAAELIGDLPLVNVETNDVITLDSIRSS